MSSEPFEHLVERLSLRAQRHPTLYRLQVMGLALLGYLYIFVLVIGALVVSAGVAAICLFKPVLLVKLVKIIWLPIWFAWSVLRALWVRLEPPQGRALTAKEAPKLFEEIERIRSGMKGPVPYQVLLTDDYNAAVTQVPRLGLLGWRRSYLILGLPLMSALSPDQFRAVIAHEFGHLCAGDSKLGGRIYHARTTWARLQEQMHGGSFLIRKFLDWFAPTFNAYTFVLARAQEYAADQASVRMVGAGPASEALVLAGLGAQFQDAQVWDPLWARVRDEPEPAQRPHSSLLASRNAWNGWTDAQTQLDRALKRETDWADTHPALTDRLEAIGAQGALPRHEGPSAAEVFLGPLAATLAGELDARWLAAVSGKWRERHEEVRAQRAELGTIEEKAAAGGLSEDECWRRAKLTEDLTDATQALPLYDACLAAKPDDPAAMFAVGRLRLARDDESGFALLRRAGELDGDAIKPAAEIAYRYLMDRGRGDDAQPWQDAWTERENVEQAARAERAEFGIDDDYGPHALDAEQAAAVARSLAAFSFVESAWLVRKQVHHLPHWPAELLLVKPRGWRRARPKQWLQQVLDAVPVPAGTTVAIYTKDYAKLLKRIRRVSGGCVYQRK